MVIAYDNAQRRHGAMTFLLPSKQFLKFERNLNWCGATVRRRSSGIAHEKPFV
jgi:hypothetical protein